MKMRKPTWPLQTLQVTILLAATTVPAQVVLGWNSSRIRSSVFPARDSALFPCGHRHSRWHRLRNTVGNDGDIKDGNSHNGKKQNGFRSRVSNLLSRDANKKGNNARQVLKKPAEIVGELQTENKLLKEAIRQLEIENDWLHSRQRVVLETFEGEGLLRRYSEGEMAGGGFVDESNDDRSGRMIRNGKANNDGLRTLGITLTEEEMTGDVKTLVTDEDPASLWCDELDGDTCPVEPTVSFGAALRDRACWLVGLLVMQSCSGVILSRNEALLANHPVIIYFLTMLVGAGGNAGNQASVRVIRGIALGTLNERTQSQFLGREFKMAVSLSAILSCAGFLRAAVFRTPFAETIAVTCSLMIIVFSSICLGAVLPLLLQKLGVDPAHSSTTIQVIMDILGVFFAVSISSLILDSPLGHVLINKLSGT